MTQRLPGFSPGTLVNVSLPCLHGTLSGRPALESGHLKCCVSCVRTRTLDRLPGGWNLARAFEGPYSFGFVKKVSQT
jgi:hypothetical protein